MIRCFPTSRTRLGSLALVLACCSRPEASPPPSNTQELAGRENTRARAVPTPESEAPAPDGSIAFADRTSQAYILLMATDPTVLTDRDVLVAMASRDLADRSTEPEIDLLRKLITMHPVQSTAADGQASQAPRDLLGLHISIFPRSDVVPESMLADPLLTRELTPDERQTLSARPHALVLRADYRNEHAVRGLRLLQSLVQIVARDRGALIHDPDTGETMGVDAFTRRRLQARLGNVSEQIVVIPFADPLHGPDFVRLSTRGMRRFGSVDLEFDGLPKERDTLEKATMLLNGLAYAMARMAQLDPSGYPYELGDDVEITAHDVAQAYSGRGVSLPQCSGCPRTVSVHLELRPPQPHDPQDYPVARLRAPREVRDKPGFDEPTWARDTSRVMFTQDGNPP